MTSPDPKNEEPINEEPINEEPKNEEPVKIEPVKPEPVKIAPVKNEPYHEKQSFMAFVRDNIWESISYVVLFAGLILSIFNPFLGGSLVGIILGVYFSQEILDRAMSFKDLVVREGIFRGFIVIAAVLALLLEAPGLLLGTVIGAWIRPYLGKSISSPFDKQ